MLPSTKSIKAAATQRAEDDSVSNGGRCQRADSAGFAEVRAGYDGEKRDFARVQANDKHASMRMFGSRRNTGVRECNSGGGGSENSTPKMGFRR